MKRLKLILGLLLALSPVSLRASDVQIYPTGPNFALSNLVWGSSAAQGFNNNYFFVPLNTNGSVCIYVENNNPTSAHTFTASIVITPDADNTTPSDGTWQAAAANNATVLTAPSFSAGLGANISSASLVSINLSASTVQAGSPDTATVHVVQPAQGANCFSGNQSIGSAPNTVSSVPPIQAISEGLSQSFVGTIAISNPGAVNINHLFSSTTSTKSVYLDRVIIVSTVAVPVINLQSTSTLGTTCGSATPVNQKITSNVTSAITENQNCSGSPTVANQFIQNFSIAANTPAIIDLRGIIIPAGSGSGFEVLLGGAVVGTVTSTFFWYEK